MKRLFGYANKKLIDANEYGLKDLNIFKDNTGRLGNLCKVLNNPGNLDSAAFDFEDENFFGYISKNPHEGSYNVALIVRLKGELSSGATDIADSNAHNIEAIPNVDLINFLFTIGADAWSKGMKDFPMFDSWCWGQATSNYTRKERVYHQYDFRQDEDGDDEYEEIRVYQYRISQSYRAGSGAHEYIFRPLDYIAEKFCQNGDVLCIYETSLWNPNIGFLSPLDILEMAEDDLWGELRNVEGYEKDRIIGVDTANDCAGQRARYAIDNPGMFYIPDKTGIMTAGQRWVDDLRATCTYKPFAYAKSYLQEAVRNIKHGLRKINLLTQPNAKGWYGHRLVDLACNFNVEQIYDSIDPQDVNRMRLFNPHFFHMPGRRPARVDPPHETPTNYQNYIGHKNGEEANGNFARCYGNFGAGFGKLYSPVIFSNTNKRVVIPEYLRGQSYTFGQIGNWLEYPYLDNNITNTRGQFISDTPIECYWAEGLQQVAPEPPPLIRRREDRRIRKKLIR